MCNITVQLLNFKLKSSALLWRCFFSKYWALKMVMMIQPNIHGEKSRLEVNDLTVLLRNLKSIFTLSVVFSALTNNLMIRKIESNFFICGLEGFLQVFAQNFEWLHLQYTFVNIFYFEESDSPFDVMCVMRHGLWYGLRKCFVLMYRVASGASEAKSSVSPVLPCGNKARPLL